MKKNEILFIGILILVLILMLLFNNFNKKIKTYEVAFMIEDGTIISTQMVKEGEKAIKPNDPQKEGYAFVAWTCQDKIYDFSQEVKSNLKLKANWIENQKEKELVNVKFDSDGGTTIANQIIEKGNKVVKPEEPIKEGFTFKKWTLNNIEYDFEKAVTRDLELKAEWEKVQSESSKENNNKDKTNNSNNNSQVQSDNTPQPATPTLSVPAGALGLANLTIIYEGAYGTEESWTTIDGYELYEKVGNQYNLIHTSETIFNTNVTIDVGESRTFVARVYVYNKTNQKVYSSYSNEKVISRSIPATPTLSVPAGAPGLANLTIIYEGAYGTEESWTTIDGYELYEKVGNQYNLIHTSETIFNTNVTIDVGESRTFVARVYVYNKTNQKVYSSYSNEVTI